MKQSIKPLKQFFVLLIFSSCILASCTQTRLLYKPIVLNRDRLEAAFNAGRVDMLIFQTKLEEARHRKEKFGLVAFTPSADSMGMMSTVKVYKNVTDDLFEKRPGEVFQRFDRFKKDVNNAYGNYNLRKGDINLDLFKDYRYILLYPGLLEDDKRYIKYDVYYALNITSLPSDTLVTGSGKNYIWAREVEKANTTLNPSPPR